MPDLTTTDKLMITWKHKRDLMTENRKSEREELLMEMKGIKSKNLDFGKKVFALLLDKKSVEVESSWARLENNYY